MALTFPLPVAQFQGVIKVSRRGFFQNNPRQIDRMANGIQLPSSLGAVVWRGSFSVPPTNDRSVSARRDALLSVLDRPGSSFLVYDPAKTHPAADPDGAILGSATPSILSVSSSDARLIGVQGLPAGYVLTGGDYIGWSDGRRNLLTETDGLDGGGWSELTNVAAGAGTRYVTPDVATAPDGTTTADKLIESTDSDLQRIFKAVTVTDGAEYTFSAHLKADDRTQVQLRTTALVGPVFDLSAGTMDATGSAMDDQGIISLGDGWYRCWFKTTGSGAADVPQIVLRSGGSGTYTGDGASGVLVWGVQYEPGDLTAYQPVTDGTEFPDTPRYWLHRVVSDVTADASGEIAEVEVTPFVQPGAAPDMAVTLIKPVIKAILDPDPDYGDARAVVSSGVNFSFVQTLG